ncbi:MAG: glycosyltransferase [Patescibacteria group bacterium]
MQTIKEKSQIAEKEWSKSYDVLWKVVNKKQLKVGAEVGVAYGGHSEKILEKTKAFLFSIDPYKNFESYDDPMNISQKKFDQLYKFTKERLAKFKNRSKLLRLTSAKAVNKIDKLDFIYIDADHSYDGVKNDIVLWFNKIKVGGIIAGHDYNHPNFTGVKRAVDEFFNRFNWKINYYPSGVWWVEKKKINISFIIPAFNCADTLVETVNSIYSTNFEDGDEVIIVDDMSTDKTLELATNLKKKNKDLKVFRHKINKGGGAARNTAVENAKNPLIFCLDSDNILTNKSIEKLKKSLINNYREAISFAELKFFQKNKNNITHSWKFNKESYGLNDFFVTYRHPSASGNYLYTKNSWLKAGRYPEDVQALDTWGFGFRQIASNFKIYVLKDSFYFHRVSTSSYWNRESKKNNLSLLAITIILPHLDKLDKKIISNILNIKKVDKWFNEIEKSKKPKFISSFLEKIKI